MFDGYLGNMSRTKGSANTLKVTARDAVWKVFHELGGVQHMKRWATENPSEFYKLYARLVPTQVTGEDGGPVKITVEWQPSSES
jgi:hypothetical protein